ncbi:hypothetical protein RRG08_060760 [Elysia crispata]|uniref:Uncharacterized protein n=1 Tax=Elysia crispata TaxID=231223 RepID=A0AAE0Y025_9GAST|nr:hypothetical protein RRG08_060760 [Elysia crispata]
MSATVKLLGDKSAAVRSPGDMSATIRSFGYMCVTVRCIEDMSSAALVRKSNNKTRYLFKIWFWFSLYKRFIFWSIYVNAFLMLCFESWKNSQKLK